MTVDHTREPSSSRLSVVVPTFRRPELLGKLLASLERQTSSPDRFEVIVVDDASGDSTERILAASGLPNLRWIIQPANSGPAAARNRGTEEANAGIVLFLDDDVSTTPDLVEDHLRRHEEANDRHLGILGRVDWDPELRITPFMRWLDRSGLQFAYDTWLREGPVDPPYAAFYTANLSIRRELLIEAGGFDERFPYPAYEDFEFAWRLTRLGLRMHYDPRLLVFHTRPIDLPTFRSRMRKVAESEVLLRAKWPDFPLGPGPAQRYPGRRRQLLLRMQAPIARLLGREDILARYFHTEVAAAYTAARDRALAGLHRRGAAATR